ncbi:AAA family ATPase [Vibrio crassostreae]|uniref:AAA family ATPase n=1 Tax=Vibrio crassostreae TaxID=246167 RepID=UPI000F50AB43|nr:AAA family ATPase [Vibrio crassostreae]RPF11561.1 AAA domain-containing protein [Vibrio crassostreae]
MGKSLNEIAQDLKNQDPAKPVKKVQLIYAFNGTGKTRLSREFKELLEADIDTGDDDTEALSSKNILYYNAFTEDLFYWDNDLNGDEDRKLKIHPNAFTKWVLEDQGQGPAIIDHFKRLTNSTVEPLFNSEYTTKGHNDQDIVVKAFSEVSFSQGSGEQTITNIKISKGEESNLIWSIFYSLLEQVIEELNTPEPEDRSTNDFDNLTNVFIDDPVSSLDENHLIELAVDLAELIRSNQSELKFIITTHNPLFFNVLFNELNSDDKDSGYKKKWFKNYRLDKEADGTFLLEEQPKDSAFSYHLHLKSELEKAIETGALGKYHFNYLRNILEKTTIFLGYKRWGELLPQAGDGNANPYEARIMNLRSHSKYAGEEMVALTDDEKRVLTRLIRHLDKIYKPDLTDVQ